MSEDSNKPSRKPWLIVGAILLLGVLLVWGLAGGMSGMRETLLKMHGSAGQAMHGTPPPAQPAPKPAAPQ